MLMGEKEVCMTYEIGARVGKKMVLKLGSFNGAKLHRIFLITQSDVTFGALLRLLLNESY